jgi:hypothetical protein
VVDMRDDAEVTDAGDVGHLRRAGSRCPRGCQQKERL